jgi:hypothetical protein
VKTIAWLLFVVSGLATLSCSPSGSTPAPQPCDQACKDGTATRSMREAMKLAYNVLLQGKPVGAQDGSHACPLGGSVHVFGQATSNTVQGATMVELTYELDHCGYAVKDSDATQTYSMTFTGTVTENGTIAVQPSSTTALDIKSDAMTLSGTVFDPPIDYQETACPIVLGQSGNKLSGTICGRVAGVTL